MDNKIPTAELPMWRFDNGWICPHCGCKHHYYRVEETTHDTRDFESSCDSIGDIL